VTTQSVKIHKVRSTPARSHSPSIPDTLLRVPAAVQASAIPRVLFFFLCLDTRCKGPGSVTRRSRRCAPHPPVSPGHALLSRKACSYCLDPSRGAGAAGNGPDKGRRRDLLYLCPGPSVTTWCLGVRRSAACPRHLAEIQPVAVLRRVTQGLEALGQSTP